MKKLRFGKYPRLCLCFVLMLAMSCKALKPDELTVSKAQHTWVIQATVLPDFSQERLVSNFIGYPLTPVFVVEGNYRSDEDQKVTALIFKTHSVQSAMQFRENLLASGMIQQIKMTEE